MVFKSLNAGLGKAYHAPALSKTLALAVPIAASPVLTCFIKSNRQLRMKLVEDEISSLLVICSRIFTQIMIRGAIFLWKTI